MENELVSVGERYEFAREILKKRGLIRAKHYSWLESRNGIVVHANKQMLTVLFLTHESTTMVSYYDIKISEVTAGAWELIFTNDFEHFYTVKGGVTEEDIDLPRAVRKLFREVDDDGDNENATDSGVGNF